ncbi:MAG TPA: phosphoribosylaminoimidazolesuccinocarboxamide synthase [Actinomycetales bacterium]|nr:phosphoribosylaminoimidazolesuccinocarboxamide synthase [Actinomycetales bacterium]
MAGPAQIPGWKHVYSGKVRDLYVPAEHGGGRSAQDGALADQADARPEGAAARTERADARPDQVLVVASDRISAYDFVLPTEIPGKGQVLTALSMWWFDQLEAIVPNHVLSLDVPEVVAGRAMICRNLDMFPVECVARGYLTGSGLADYRATGEVCGVALPPGMRDGDRLPQRIFTPATKAEVGEHDENVDFATVAAEIGTEDAHRLRELTLSLYQQAESIVRERGVILADTKFEFGRDAATGEIVLGDEVLTPDSSRFWSAEEWQPGRAQPSFDKQYVRDWLTSDASGWDRHSGEALPELPAEVVERTAERYREAYRRLTGLEI